MPPERSPDDEARRLSRLRALGILDAQPEPAVVALVGCAARLTDCPAAALSLVDADRVWLKATHGLPAITLPRGQSLCPHTLAQDGVLEVPDLQGDPRMADAVAAAHWQDWRLYAGVPLHVEGVRVGALFVLDRIERQLTPAQRDALLQLADVASGLLAGAARQGALELERSRLADFSRASDDWMWEADAGLRLTWVSETFESVTGLSAETVIGQQLPNEPLLDLHGDPLPAGMGLRDHLSARPAVTRVLTAKTTARGLLQILRSAVAVFDADGRFTGYRGTARDVSDHVAGVRLAQVQAELLGKLSTQVPGVIFQFLLAPDRSVHFLYASDACRAMFGTEPPHDGDGGVHDAVCRALHPDDREGLLQSLADAGRQGEPWYRECRTLRDGELRWLELRAMPAPQPEGGVLWHGFAADVTARKEIELALRTGDQRWAMAAKAAGIGIAQFDPASGRIALDPIACGNHNLPADAGEMSLTDWLASLVPEDRPAAAQAVAEAFRMQGTIEARYRVPLPDGSLRTLEVFAHCMQDDQGRPTGMIGTCRDVTQQVAHEQLLRDKESAERASQAKSEFLSRVSHELRTPLNGILGFAQLMALDRESPLARDQSRRLESVLHAGRHLLALINDVLDLSRIEQGEFVLQRTPVDLAASLRATAALIQPLAEAAGVPLQLPEAVGRWVMADARGVEQVLLNLLSNAIKYNRPQGTVRAALIPESEHLCVSVTDEGPGLSAAQRAHLFEPFNRLGAEQQRVEGTGLGLVIARALATAMGGSLRFAPAPGGGSTFTLCLPAAPAPTDHPPRPAPRSTAAPAAASSRRRVLYIEDEPLNQLLMRELFKTRPHWELDIADDGQSGLARLAQDPPHLVLIDMNLPDMNGLTLIRQLRSNPATAALQCIALSADAMQSQIDAAIAAGYNAYWTKPINVPQVLDGLESALE